MDWDPADIVAELRKAGWSLRRLSFSCGYDSDALKHALRRPYPRAERIIAEALGVAPHVIWPSRYPDSVPEADDKPPGKAEAPCTHGDRLGKNTTPGD